MTSLKHNFSYYGTKKKFGLLRTKMEHIKSYGS